MKRIGLALAAGGAAAALLAGGASAAPVLWDVSAGGNGHYYEYVSTGVSWDGALAAADALNYLGLDGYLVTLTSAAESAFVRDNLTTASYWAAGSDAGNEGLWTWMAGPELGMVFWSGGPTANYAGWNGGEPNNAGDEDGLQANWNGIAWNDAQTRNGLGYVVEYSQAASAPVPEPAAWALMILGFGAAGSALRRRRGVLTVA